MSLLTSLAVRFVHVVGATVLLGGAAAVWHAIRTSPADAGVRLAAHYEWAFWGTMAAMVVTGVGNLGALGAPGPATRWGTVFTAKLVVVGAFALASFLRTLFVLAVRRAGPEAVDSRSLSRVYAATALVLLVPVALAEVLAHG